MSEHKQPLFRFDETHMEYECPKLRKGWAEIDYEAEAEDAVILQFLLRYEGVHIDEPPKNLGMVYNRKARKSFIYFSENVESLRLTTQNPLTALDLYQLDFRRRSKLMVMLLALDQYLRRRKMTIFGLCGAVLKEVFKVGPYSALKKTRARLAGREENLIGGMGRYDVWANEKRLSRRQLEEQRSLARRFAYRPLVSIVVPAYRTDKDMLEQMIGSVLDQTYDRVELCIADGGSDMPYMEEVFQRSGVRYVMLGENRGIAGNSNAALELAQGDYVGLLDHDDVLAPNAVFEMVKAINEHNRPDILYSDEDKFEKDLYKRYEPHFKPDWSPDLMRSTNYICHFFMARRSLIEEAGGFNPGYDGSQDYDLFLRLTERADKIFHVRKVLYHWRSHPGSVAQNMSAKTYAYTAGKKAIEAHLGRMELAGEVEMTAVPGFYRVRYAPYGRPKVSILIPSCDHLDDLKLCLDSIRDKTTYENYEIVVIENNSKKPETFAYYDTLEDPRIRILYWEQAFNYSAINNFGVRETDGEYVLLLNNDTEVITPDWIEEMLGFCQREDVGAVGAKLYFPDDTIQHGGVIVGYGGVGGHMFAGLNRGDLGYMYRTHIAQNLSAVTAACMLVKRSVYEQVGGLDEGYQVAFNDVDFCMKITTAGYRIVLTPFAELYHNESKSRGKDDTLEKARRFQSEVVRFRQKWPDVLRCGDPYYSPSFSYYYGMFALNEDGKRSQLPE
ncbi:MAG: glycosyltransferase family 2 protein [Christensenellales bacterium]